MFLMTCEVREDLFFMQFSDFRLLHLSNRSIGSSIILVFLSSC